MRRPDVRIRLQLTVSVCLFTLICLVSLAAAIYTLSRSTLVDLQKGNLDLNCRMRRDECRQEIQAIYETFYRLTYSSSVHDVYANQTSTTSLKSAADLLHDSFGPDRILQLKFYLTNGTGILEIDSTSLAGKLPMPEELLPIEHPPDSLNQTASRIINETGLLIGPVSSDEAIAGTNYLLSLTLPVRNDTYVSSVGSNGMTPGTPVIGFATFLFSGLKIQRVLSAVSLNSAESEIGSAALCATNDNYTEFHQLIPFDDNMTVAGLLDDYAPRRWLSRKSKSLQTSVLANGDSTDEVSSQNFSIPAKMGEQLKRGKLPTAEVNKGPYKSMISIAQFGMLSRTYYVVVLQAHHGVYAMPHALRNSVIISSCCIAAGMVIFTFLFVSFGSRQIVRLKMAAKYERPSPTKWLYMPIPWWLRPANSVEHVENTSESEYQVPEKVSLREHVRDELDDITERFNSMSDELAKQYRRLEDRVRLRKAEIEQAREAADYANAAKSHFLARVTHELRTPLNGIIGTATLCLEEENLTQIHQSLRTIFKCGELLLHLMTDLLSFSQNEVDSLKLEPRDFMLPEITSQLTAIFMEQRTAKRIELVVNADRKLDSFVFYGDTTRILQVIFNLITNGIKFTPGGGKVYFKVTSRPGPTADEKVLVFVVRDNGPGIAPEMQSRVFEAFVQGDISTSVKKAGVGLGLSICRQIAQRMRGSVELESKLGEGSTFTFTVPLPCHRVEPDSPNSQPRSLDVVSSSTSLVRSAKGSPLGSPGWSPLNAPFDPPQPAGSLSGDSSTPSKESPTSVARTSMASSNQSQSSPFAFSGARADAVGSDMPLGFMSHDAQNVSAVPTMRRPTLPSSKSFAKHPPSHLRVLVVDDNSVNQEVMMRMLNLEGLKNIDVANDGIEAVEKVKRSTADGTGFDVIFMDVQMPNMDGREATRVIRRDFEFSAPIVAVSAFANEKNADDCIAAGMTLFLSKPLRRPHLREILADLTKIAATPNAAA